MRPRSPHWLTRRAFLAGMGGLAAGLKLAPARVLAADRGPVKLLNWDSYIAPGTLPDFRAATGIEVELEIFANAEKMFTRLQGGNPEGFDLIVPSDRYVGRLIRGGMLLPVVHDRISHLSNLDPGFMNASFDPGRRYSIAYMWGTVGIGYRGSAVDGVPDSWKWVLDSDRYSGRIALMSDPQLVLQIALKYLGYSLNTLSLEQIQEAELLLKRQRPHVKAFAPFRGELLLRDGEVDLAFEWNGDVLRVMEEDDDIRYVVPKEGTMLWQDCLCIPKGARHPGEAHEFIDYLLDAEVGARNALFLRYATPNAAARALMPASYREDPAIFPSEDLLKRSEIAVYRGERILQRYEQAWQRIHAS